MKETIVAKIREQFAQMVIYKDPSLANTLFAGRNLPSFVKDFLLKRYINADGSVRQQELSSFLDLVMPKDSVKNRLLDGREVTLLTRFIVYIDLVRGERRFSIPDLGLKQGECVIPEYTYRGYKEDLVDGEMWGIIKLALVRENNDLNHIEMVNYKPFKPYRSVDLNYFKNARSLFSTDEWLDVLLSAMEYDGSSFASVEQKIHFLTRLLIFVEPRLNVIELAPKRTGKSYVFGQLSKYGWLVSGGMVTRAKLFYDKTRQQNGIIKNHDYVAFDEIQTIKFQNPAEIQSALKSYLESGKTTIDNNEFTSECGLMIMGNIPLNANMMPANQRYFQSLSKNFQDTALLDRFHCFIEGWYLPQINSGSIYTGWTLNVEYFSEVLHGLRTENSYGKLFNDLVGMDSNANIRDVKAVQHVAVGYMKLLFPHWTNIAEVDKNAFDRYCLQPAIRSRSIIREQCHALDPEFKTDMPNMWIK